ncbi:phage tail tape measure protein [Serratia marcescens]|uniref:phage tail tape measure protein n=1 Tax=Serratia marcescens TaxID=615 RepID=UPI000745316A|nr:phage tail tape measure protein [Serratia marcescens]ASM08312.1 phage tail protein [Serratia marcescens]MDP8648784.1 phage tail tape measure protein [Serratia marcescens]MDP8663637.1 phage tail tape measure protein [Serratia marcescens]MDP8737768.1 phage tail tape measure protein [Serratia marcescens]MDP8812254.1 phage tail tape measure protein [Serratia marcescens]
MAKRLDTEIIINLAGNLTAKARQYGANMSEFAQRNQRAMSVVKATSEAAGRGLDRLGNRYTAAVAGFAGGAMLREFTQVDRRMTMMGIAAEKTRAEMAAMLSGMQDASIKFRVDDSEVVSAVEKVGTVTGDIDFGYKNRNAISASIAGSGGSGESIGGLFANFTKFQIQSELEAIKAMDTLNRLGKEGAFELKDIAEKGVRAFSMYAAAGGRGVSGVKDVGVVLESAIDATGDRDTAATATENLIRDLQNPKVAKALKTNGIDVFGKDGRMRELPTLLSEVAKKSGSKGAEKQSARLLGAGFNQDSILLISSVTSGKGAENLKRYQAVVGDGKGIMDDAAYAAKDFTSAMQSLNNVWNKFSTNQLAKPVQELADALNSVDQDTVQNWLEIGKNVAIATGGLLVARKAFQIGKGTYDFLRPGKKGIPSGIADVFGSGVMPVYVTNMPGGGMGGGDLPGLPGSSDKPKSNTGGLLGLAMNTATEVASLVPFPKNDEERAALLKRAKENADRSTMWDDVKNWFSSAPTYQDPSPWASLQPQNQMGSYPMIPPQLQGKIEVSVKDDRVQVTSVKINTPGVTMSAQTGISNVEQD